MGLGLIGFLLPNFTRHALDVEQVFVLWICFTPESSVESNKVVADLKVFASGNYIDFPTYTVDD